MSIRYLPILALVASTSAGFLSPRQVAPPGDNCLRAIRNTARPGTADCSSFLKATVTPATSTFYETATVTQISTETDTQTATETILVTVTNTIPTTLVFSTEVFTTITSEVALAKRQETIVPSKIPAYASPCSGAVRYSSACSELGVLPTTVTVAAPSTTITLPATISMTETVSPTLASTSVTETETFTTILIEATKTETTLTTNTLPAQCLNLASSPVNYQSAGRLVLAGVGDSFSVSASSAEECCSACYNNPVCFGFAYGNYDPTYYDTNDWSAPPPVTSETKCYTYQIVAGDQCVYDWIAFGPVDGEPLPDGGIASFGYGRCRVLPF